MTDSMILHDFIAAAPPDSLAIAAPERQPLTYAGLTAQIADIGRALAKAGIAPRDKVAIVLPNGPDMASAFLGVACAAVAAPLNPAYKAA